MTASRASLMFLAAIVAISPVFAQQPASAGAGFRAHVLTREERAALQALQTAAASYDRFAQDAALAAARAAVRGPDGRYALGLYQLQIGQARQDASMIGQAVDLMIESGLASPSELPSLVANQVNRAYFAGDVRQAERLLTRLAQLQPSNPVVIADHAQLKARLGDKQQAVALLQHAIQLQGAGGPVPESWRLRAVALAVEAGMAPQSVTLARDLVQAHPTALNWRDALLVYRQAAQADPALDLDIKRLMRAAEALAGERDYLDLAQALGQQNLHGEVKAVLDEGISRGMLDPNEAIVRQTVTANNRRVNTDRTGLPRLRTQATAAAEGRPARAAADAHFGHGLYAEAIELYRLALQKGGEDPNLVNTRLGAALALAGQRAEAEAAFRAVTGSRADLAAFWLVWLARRAG